MDNQQQLMNNKIINNQFVHIWRNP